MPARKDRSSDKSPLRLLIWTAVAGLIFGLIGMGELPEDLLRAARNSLHQHKASGDIVLVKFDDKSLREVGRWPWPRGYYAEMIKRLDQAGADGIYVDFILDTKTTPEEDAKFEQALEQHGQVTIAALPETGPDSIGLASRPILPLERFTKHARLGSVSIRYNWQNAVWHVPYASRVGEQPLDSFSALLAGRTGPPGKFYVPDYSIDPVSIPSVSASDLLNGRADPSAFAGKNVVIGAASDSIGDTLFVPGTGRMPGAYVHIIGAETLKAGAPVYLGWLPLFVAALGIAWFAAKRSDLSRRLLILGGSVLAMLVGPALLEANQVYLDVTPGLFVLITVASVLAWRGFRRRGLIDAVSGLPNLSALRSNRIGREQALIAARILNYEEIVATLPAASERQLIDQIVARLSVGAPDRTLYQGDGGIFAWFEESQLPFGHHIDALHTLFRNPARVGRQAVDLSVSFGVEIGSSRSLSNRLASALVAAEEAAHDGLKWKYHDPETLQDASWKLSILSQLDAAVDKGEVWVAYQPKLELATRKVVGAEALARWTHPEKGPIAASEFVAAAEQNDRIGKLTDFVLEQAIGAAASINRRHQDFSIAVNLSARLLSDKGLMLRLSSMLARHQLPPHLLTLELTETAALAGSGSSFDMLMAIRELGISISIDDYGTGLSTLEYLKKVPAGEIKIDQGFVKGMVDNRSDRLMVQSTISLAHSLGRTVVAEGVERKDILDLLIEMECDQAQGFIIGRPMSLQNLNKRVSGASKSNVA